MLHQARIPDFNYSHEDNDTATDPGTNQNRATDPGTN